MFSAAFPGGGTGLMLGGVNGGGLAGAMFARYRLLISSSPPTPAAAATAAVPPAAVRNLRRSMSVVIVPSGGCPRWAARR